MSFKSEWTSEMTSLAAESCGAEVNPVDFIQLQQYMEYSSMRVKDVVKEFNAGGKLVQHKSGDHVDRTGFSLFLKSYLEADNLPTELCQHLFQYFQDSELCKGKPRDDYVCLKAMSCYFSVLEEGKPRDKLEFTFKLYDKDGNGYLDKSEVDAIITQMMRAADYLGWEVTELRPVLEDTMTAIDADSSGTVTQQEWILGGMNNVPLQVLLGLKIAEQDSQHTWRMKNFTKPTYCCVCDGMLMGLRKQGLCCSVCKYTVHSRCANKSTAPCVRTHVKSKAEIGVPAHDWIRTESDSSKCDFCQKKIKTLAGKRCAWCHLIRHDECAVQGSSECDCGPLRDHILPPWCISPLLKEDEGYSSCGESVLMNMTSEGTQLHITPPPQTHPLLVFVNPKSGGKQGERVMRKLQYLLNPRQVFNLNNGGPSPGLHFFRNVQQYRVLVCGGDGTVGWILDAIDKADLPVCPPVAVLPLGTGNDLARCLRWGGGYEGSDLSDILKEVEGGVGLPMDRWSVQVIPDNPEEEGDPVPYEIINNYFSIGVDASIAHRFHALREKNPQKFNSRAKNKLYYFELATSETISASCKKLSDCLSIECCGVPLDLSSLDLQGVAVLNIPSMHGGSNLWGESRKDEAESDTNVPEVITDHDTLKSSSQDLSDKRLEVVGLEGALEMGQIYSGLKSMGRRLAQTAHLTIRTLKALPMQIDGEPWMQPPSTIHISHKNQANMLMAAPVKSSGFFHHK
ncbi:diacylglycerol kinase, alpha b isoform X1 [Clupea harengus]|uniref:Diacylglycerol kinase n=2 Tax=Clupea harengus TaxID=7950 RepID=A0A6P8FK71_CLUHA|nr:diacylglycerol kinase, alpha b isoform X1 [Clupea harengus]